MNKAIFIFVFLALVSCQSEVTYESFKKDIAKVANPIDEASKSITIEDSNINAIAEDNFEISITTSNDSNDNSSAIFYYCNETDTPSCDPLLGDTQALSKTGTGFFYHLTGLTSPYDPGDTLNYIVVITDPDGVENIPSAGQITLSSVNNIFRSVGVGMTAALDDHNGGSDTISITTDTVTFSSALDAQVGVGDILVYDSGTKLAVVNQIMSSTVLKVSKADGVTNPDVQVTNNDWEIYRAYTSLVNAESGVENTGIPAAIRDFDTWSGGRDLVTNNERWNILLYRDAADVGGVTVAGWTTSSVFRLNILSATGTGQVFQRQRHDGFFANKYARVITSTTNAFIINNNYVSIQGLQIEVGTATANNLSAIEVDLSSSTGVIIKDNLIKDGDLVSTGRKALNFIGTTGAAASAEVFGINNIIFSFDTAVNFNTTGSAFFYNNTLVKNTMGIDGAATGNFIAKNNIIQNSTTAFLATINYVDSDYNLTDHTTATGGSNDKVSTILKLNSKMGFDYRTASDDFEAIGTGLDLSADSYFSFNTDINGLNRTRWDRGANLAAKAIFRSIGQNNNSSLANGAGNDLNISLNSDGHSVANFNSAVANNIGVGDVIEYDQDNAGGVDSLAFISKRIDAQNFIVKNAQGENAILTNTATQVWNIFRAYDSIAASDDANENSAFNAVLRDFDTWSGGRDMVANNEQWNYVLYADEKFNQTINLTSTWTSSSQNYLHYFAPYSKEQVGTSQRHEGKWDDEKVAIEASAGTGLAVILYLDNIRLEGIQFKNTYTAGSSSGSITSKHVTYGDYSSFYFMNNIVRRDAANPSPTNNVMDISSAQGAFYVVGNLIYGPWARSIFSTGTVDHSSYHILNNTMMGTTSSAISKALYGTNSDLSIINNIIQPTSGGSFSFSSTLKGREYIAKNITTDSTITAGGDFTDNITNTTLTNTTFVDMDTFDYRLKDSDSMAKNAGEDPYSQIGINDYVDIMQNTYGLDNSWDIGAHEAANLIYRSVGPGSTSALVSGTGNGLTITSGVANFSSSISTSIGVGDALVIDRSGDGPVDDIVFIHKRNSNSSFDVRDAQGNIPEDMASSDEDWQVFRAYTTASDVDGAQENTGIPLALRNFDDHNGSFDLRRYNQKLNLALYADAVDTLSSAFSGFETTKVNSVRAFTPYLATEVGTRQRHLGKLDTTNFYTISFNASLSKVVAKGYMTIEGVQFTVSGGPYTDVKAVSAEEASEVFVHSNLVTGITDVGSGAAFWAEQTQNTNAKIYFYNNLAYDNTTGPMACFGAHHLAGASTNVYFYNNTAVNCSHGFESLFGTTKIHMANNIAANNTINDFNAAALESSATNISSDATSPNASLRSLAVTFSNVSEDDYRLTPDSFLAKDQGSDLSSLSFFNKDVIENQRGQDGSWDIGFHEAPARIYRSIGQGTIGALATGTGNDLLINNGVASFGVALADNIGVGDALQYDSDGNGSIDSLVFISYRNSSTSYVVRTNTGALPSDLVSADNDWSIFRAFTSRIGIDSASVENASLDPAVSDFETYLNGEDLVALNTQRYFAFYADAVFSGGLDADNWDVNWEKMNEVVYFAPKEAHHVGISQRHSGYYDESKVLIEAGGDVGVDTNFPIKVIGLQIKVTSDSTTDHGIGGNFSKHVIDNIIIDEGTSTQYNMAGVSLYGNSVAINNVVIGFPVCFFQSSGSTIAYNNTAVNCAKAFDKQSGNDFIIKNNIAQDCSNVCYEGTFVSENNLASDSSASGTSAIDNVDLDFIDPSNYDFRLDATDMEAVGVGQDLSADNDYAFNLDASGAVRSSWDLGSLEFIDFSGLTEFNDVGDGTATSPYQIFNATQLRDIGVDTVEGCNATTASACSDHFKLIKDITMDAGSFTPVGITNGFSGVFDGNNKTIDNFVISDGASDYQALIGYCNSGEIKNLTVNGNVLGNTLVGLVLGFGSGCTLDNIVASGTATSNGGGAGILAGQMNGGSLSNSSASGSVSDNNIARLSFGGLIGRSSGSATTNSFADVTVSTISSSVGGLIGNCDNCNLGNSYALGDVSGDNRVGGLIGAGGKDGGTISNVYAKGKVVGTGSNIGGLVGNFNRGSSILSNCYATGDVDGEIANVGGLIGSMAGATETQTIEDCYATGNVKSNGVEVGGLVGNIDDSSGSKIVQRSWASGDVKGDSEVGGLVGDAAETIIDSFAMGNVSCEDGRAGGLIGSSYNTTVTRSYATGNVSQIAFGLGYGGLGGLVGTFTGGTYSETYATGNVYAVTDKIGGLVGNASIGAILKSYATGVVRGRDIVGGLIGHKTNATNDIDESYALGDVFGRNKVGGFIGVNEDSNIDNSYSKGAVFGASEVGGFIGELVTGAISSSFTNGFIRASTATNIGAFAGLETGGTFSNVYFNTTENSEAAGSATGLDDFIFRGSLPTGFSTTYWGQLMDKSLPYLKSTTVGTCMENPTALTYTDIGSGTLASPYLICNADQLKSIGSNDCSAHYKLGQDIDLKGENFSFYTICNMGGLSGSFDGNNKTILNFYSDNHSLIAQGNAGSYIKNLKLNGLMQTSVGDPRGLISNVSETSLLNVHVQAKLDASNMGSNGGLVGYANGDENQVFAHSSFIGSVNGSLNTAGITGRASGIFSRLKSFGSVDINNYSASGIIGNIGDTGIVKQVKSFMDVSGASNIGGVCGRCDGVVSQAYAHSNIDVTIERGGALAGYLFAGDAYDSYALGSVDGNSTANVLGGFSGIGVGGGVLKHNYNYADVINPGATDIGAFTGTGSSTSSIENNFWFDGNGEIDGRGNGTGSEAGRYVSLGQAGLVNQANFTGWDFINTWAIGGGIRMPRLRWDLHPVCQFNMTATEFDDIGSGTISEPYLLCFKEQILDLGNDTTNGCNDSTAAGCSAHFKILNDIDFKGVTTFTPIGSAINPFSGSFDGQNHTLSNLVYFSGAGTNRGFFGSADSAVITNMKLIEFDFTSGATSGVLAGNADDSFISDIEIYAKTNFGDNSGGLVGTSYQSFIRNSRVFLKDGSSFGSSSGGLIGQATVLLDNSYVSGSLTSTGDYIGGAIGQTTASAIRDVHSSVDISITDGFASWAGGFMGQMANSLVSGCSATGDVVSAGGGVGGFVADAAQGSITNSFSSGAVSGISNVGGFAGQIGDAGGQPLTLLANYSSGTSSSEGFAGGYQDNGNLTVSNNYWNSTTSGVSTGARAGEYEPLTTTQMQNSVNFTGWNFTSDWRITGGSGPDIIKVSN
ncbi:MAG: hypothetical protein QF441_07005 [Bacteriovoracaceae bacterium]|nr:hypothetical protein [Bacteriovoracaceae bacterium]